MAVRWNTLLKLSALLIFVFTVQALLFSRTNQTADDLFPTSPAPADFSSSAIHPGDTKDIFARLVSEQQQPFLGRFLECSDSDELLVFVHSRPEERERRIHVRNTWGSRRLRDNTLARVFFVVGHNGQKKSQAEQRALQWEQDIHNDIIQGDFVEGVGRSYDDLKSIIWLTWSERQCPNVPLLFKTDTDTFVDLIALSDNLAGRDDVALGNATLFCKVDFFDEVRLYCAGDSYLLSNETRRSLLEGFHEERDFFDSSAKAALHFVTGALAPLTGIALVEGDGLVWSPHKRFSFLESPIVPDRPQCWDQMQEEHGLDPVPPVYLTNFSTTTHERYTINSPDFCRLRWPDLETLVVVHTSPSQADYRHAIRQTWADPRVYPLLHLRPLFFLGRSPDPIIERDLRQESEIHGDIIQTDYLDTYKNLTFKAVSWMRWVEEFCQHVPSLVKSDDDMVIDVFKLKHYLDRMHRTLDMTTHSKFHCYYWRYGRIERNPNHRHFVPKAVFAARRFPAYCSGSAFILSPHISQVLLDEFRRDSSYLWVDDVFVTGILAKRAGVKHHSMASAYAFGKRSLSDDKTRKRMVFAHLSGSWSHTFRHELWGEILLKHGVRLLETGGYENATVFSTTTMTSSAKV